MLIGIGAGALNDPMAVDFDEAESRVGFRATTLANDDNRLSVFNWQRKGLALSGQIDFDTDSAFQLAGVRGDRGR